MARVMLMLALCVLTAILSEARPVAKPMILQGKVYCDTCRAGFETSATTYITGAKVRVECKDRGTQELLYSKEGTTDSTGTYKILVSEDHSDQLCDAVLVSSPQSDCASVDHGCDQARVILTRNNGMTSDTRFANSMGFMMDQPMSGCDKVLQQYQEFED
ncbi:unnamed protein product [Ilex paraguariensis]|uniref:Uncharacterized protein n=1 Tax=Ilex paraguariensis TaxID=185542 RepID=A0ABC8TXR7_9AQUA